ncbi:unnamed protein product [Rotaria sordida]|uniref:Aldehyde oxidase/xanthine dehydrogenase first molybdopterin binding domain-containing protein n=1 Tax=Rotaria sordida TaxID=392033 RepID=A0A814R683_9BILA|nr:unnamed protein product [Rotaria sordida]
MEGITIPTIIDLIRLILEFQYGLYENNLYQQIKEDAIIHQSYFGDEISLRQGDIDDVFRNAKHILEDTLYIGGQEHFYMETNSCIVIPSNDEKEITLYAGTQDPTSAQEIIAFVLGRNVNHVTCHVKRIGGAFGGKGTRSHPLCAAVAVAAVKLGTHRISTDDQDTPISILPPLNQQHHDPQHQIYNEQGQEIGSMNINNNDEFTLVKSNKKKIKTNHQYYQIAAPANKNSIVTKTSSQGNPLIPNTSQTNSHNREKNTKNVISE